MKNQTKKYLEWLVFIVVIFAFVFARQNIIEINVVQSFKSYDPKKAVIIPGWMQTVEHYSRYHGFDIWTQNIDPKNKIDSKYVIGHSMGGSFALVNWKYNRNTKLILINPVAPKRSPAQAAQEIMRAVIMEGLDSKKIVPGDQFTTNVGKALNFLEIDPIEIMREVSKENLTVICGSDDKYICDQGSVITMKNDGINVIEIPGAGHNWSVKFDDEIDKIISKDDN